MNVHLRPRRHVRCAGFSLVELLVVVSIISLLIALLLPSLKRARDQSRLTVCLSNIRGQGAAVLIYAQDHGGALPPKLVQWTEAGGRSGPWLINAFLARYQGQPFKPVAVGWPAPTGVWRCPEIGESEDAVRTTHSGVLHAAPNQWLFNSMNINDDAGRVNIWGDTLPGWEDRTERYGWRRIEQVRSPVDTIMLMDNVTFYVHEHYHRDAREYIGRSCDVITDPNLHAYCGDNQGAHVSLNRRPAVFLDGHADGVPFSSAFWMTLRETYRPMSSSSGAIQLYAREVRHLLWFVEPGDLAVDEGGED